jgi:hypothetical protein
MKVAITGSNGYIGENIINALKKADIEVMPVKRQLLYGEHQVLARQISGCHAIINLAGAPIIKRWTSKNKAVIYNSRVLVTKNLCHAINSLAIEEQPSVFISASATGIYKENESHDELSSNFANNFAASVVADWEDASSDLGHNIRRVIFRMGLVLGKESQVISGLLPSFKLGLGAKIGQGNQPFPFIHVADVVKAYMQATYDNQYSGIFNLSAPEQITNAEFTKAFARSVSKPAFLFVPQFILKLALGKAAQMIYENPWVIPAKLARLGFGFEYPTIDQAMDEIVRNE